MSQFFRNFDDDTLNATPTGFTGLFGSADSDWEVVEYATAGPDQYLNNVVGGTDRDGIGWEQGTDLEVVTRVYRDTGAGDVIAGPGLRMDTGGAETGYTVWGRAGANTMIVRHESGSETTLTSVQLAEGHRWVIFRFRVNSSDIKLRIHPETTFVSSARSANDDFVVGPTHFLQDNMEVQLTADTLPGGLSSGTNYYVRRIDDNQFALQSSSPVDGGASDIDITSDGSNITITVQDDETARSDWNYEITDSNITGNGYAGMFDIFGRAYYDWIGIGTAGDTAPSSAVGGATEVSFSLNNTQSITDSSTSTAESSLTVSATQGISDGSTATSETDILLDAINALTSQSTASAEASVSLPTVHSVTLVGASDNIVEASLSVGLSTAISNDSISTVEVSYSLDASQQIATSGLSTAEANLSLSLQSAISLLSTALAEADISISAVQSISLDGQEFTATVTLATGRTLTVKFVNRTLNIDPENRTLTIKAENRTLNIDP